MMKMLVALVDLWILSLKFNLFRRSSCSSFSCFFFVGGAEPLATLVVGGVKVHVQHADQHSLEKIFTCGVDRFIM